MSRFFKRRRGEAAKPEPTRQPAGEPGGHRVQGGKTFAARLREAAGQVLKPTHEGDDIPEPHPASFDRYAELSMDPEVDTAIMMRAGMEVGVGYQTEPPDGAKEAYPSRKDRVDRWARDNNLDGLLRVIDEARYRYGYCPVQREPLLVLQPEYFWVHRNKYGETVRYSQRRDRYGTEITRWRPSEVVLFTRRWSPSRPYGISVVEPIVRQLDTRNEVNDELPDVIANVAYPFRVFVSRTEAMSKTVEDNVANRERYENVFLYNFQMNPNDPDLTIHEVKTDPRFNPTPMLEHMDFEINEGLMSPHLTYLKNATEASANMMMTAIMLDVQSEQRYLRRVMEHEFYQPLVGEPVPKHVWNSPQPRIVELTVQELATVLRNLTPDVIGVPEARNILRRYFHLEDKQYPEKPPKAHQAPTPVPFANNGGQAPPVPAAAALEMVLTSLQEAYEAKQIDVRMALDEGRKAIEAHVEEAKLAARRALRREELSPESVAEYGVLRNELFDDYRERLVPLGVKLPAGKKYVVEVE